jgi:HEAT repeat protein
MRVADALERAGGTPAYPGVVNAAINVLAALDALERAHAVAEEAMRHSKTPYYYMADLASIDEDRGDTESALDWYARAYREATGPATRFQWGTNYVRGLIRMAPDDDSRVREAAVAVLGELDGPDRIYRRTRTRLETLDSSLRAWNADGDHDAAIAAIRGRMGEICARVPSANANAPVLASCRDFLADASAL